VQNVAADNAASRILTYRFDNAMKNADEYWVSYILGAYQYVTTEDQDPDLEDAVFGVVDAIRGLGASVFLELVSQHELSATDSQVDTEAFWANCRMIGRAAAYKTHFRNRYVAAHEFGHLFGGVHTDEGLMSGNCEHSGLSFGNASLGAFRKTRRPNFATAP
jgi:hypothetical protein